MTEVICNCGHAAESHERRVGCLSGTCDCKRTPGEIYRDAIAALRAEVDGLREALQDVQHRLEVASKEATENGWIPTAPQWFKYTADILAAALAKKAG
jgi:hypothetical protein